jgi:Uma2 family endonuclease
MSLLMQPELMSGEWEALEDPPGHKFEVVQGELVMTPAPGSQHGLVQARLIVDLSPFVPSGFGISADSEWRLEERGWVAQAPRPDLMVIPLRPDPVTEPPLLAVEILSPSDHRRLERSELTRIEGKRLDYAQAGLQHYLEIDLDVPFVRRFEFTTGPDPVDVAEGDEVLRAGEPFPYEVCPGALLRGVRGE